MPRRQGSLRAVGLRIPGVVARPPGATGLKSPFLCEVFCAAQGGRPYMLPVSPDGTSLIASVNAVAGGIARALLSDNPELDRGMAVNLPALRVRLSALVETLQDQCAIPEGLISYHPDAEPQRTFARQGFLDSSLGSRLGIAGNPGLAVLVGSALAEV